MLPGRQVASFVAMKRSFLAALVVLIVAAIGLLGFETARFVAVSPAPAAEAVSKPLTPVEVNPAWIKQGKPSFAQVEIYSTPDGRTSSGLWSCTGPTTFEWQFAVDETVYVLEGEVEITYQGHQFTLRPGDTATFHGGTSAVWKVSKYLKKSYALHNPGPLGRLWRMVFPAS